MSTFPARKRRTLFSADAACRVNKLFRGTQQNWRTGKIQNLHFKRQCLHIYFLFLPSYKSHDVLLSAKTDEKLPLYFVLG